MHVNADKSGSSNASQDSAMTIVAQVLVPQVCTSTKDFFSDVARD